MNSYSFHIYFILFIFLSDTYLILKFFTCLTLPLADTEQQRSNRNYNIISSRVIIKAIIIIIMAAIAICTSKLLMLISGWRSDRIAKSAPMPCVPTPLLLTLCLDFAPWLCSQECQVSVAGLHYACFWLPPVARSAAFYVDVGTD